MWDMDYGLYVSVSVRGYGIWDMGYENENPAYITCGFTWD